MNSLNNSFEEFLKKYRNGVGLSESIRNDLFAAFKAGIDYQAKIFYNKLNQIECWNCTTKFLYNKQCPKCGYYS